MPNVGSNKCSQIGDHPQENLAKFDYKPDMKVKKFNDLFYVFRLPIGPCKIFANWGHFFHTKILSSPDYVSVEIILFQVKK